MFMKTNIEADDGITGVYQTLFYENMYEKVTTCIREATKYNKRYKEMFALLGGHFFFYR